MFPRRSRSKTPGGNAKEGLYVQTFKPLPPMNSKQRINMLKNKTTVNAFHSSHSAGVAGKGINTTASLLKVFLFFFLF
uniref:ALTO n=1 Tax=Meloidogyne incognita TaxID=6306 RepID=A0A914MW18_MELIC